jgi:hypothetical protein
MYRLVAVKKGRAVECVPGFASRRDAQHEADRLNALPAEWQEPDGRIDCRPHWEAARQPRTFDNRAPGGWTGLNPPGPERVN